MFFSTTKHDLMTLICDYLMIQWWMYCFDQIKLMNKFLVYKGKILDKRLGELLSAHANTCSD